MGWGRGKEGTRTNNNGCDLGDLSDVIIGLHDALYARDRKVVLDGDVVGVGQVGNCRHLWERRVGDVVCIVHSVPAGEMARHGALQHGVGDVLGRCWVLVVVLRVVVVKVLVVGIRGR